VTCEDENSWSLAGAVDDPSHLYVTEYRCMLS